MLNGRFGNIVCHMLTFLKYKVQEAIFPSDRTANRVDFKDTPYYFSPVARYTLKVTVKIPNGLGGQYFLWKQNIMVKTSFNKPKT